MNANELLLLAGVIVLAVAVAVSSAMTVKVVLGRLMDLHERYDDTRDKNNSEILRLLKLHQAEMLSMARESVAVDWIKKNGVAPMLRDSMDNRVKMDVAVLMKRLGLSEIEAVAYLRQQVTMDNADSSNAFEKGLRNGA